MMVAAMENKGAVVRPSTDPAQPGVHLPQRAVCGWCSLEEKLKWRSRGGRVVVGFQKVVMVRFL